MHEASTHVARTWFRDEGVRQSLRAADFAPDRLIADSGGRIVKNYSKVLVAELPSDDGARFLKWYRFPSWRHRLKAGMGASPAAAYLRGARLATAKGFIVPEVLAMVHRGMAALPSDAMVLTGAVQGGRTLGAFLDALAVPRDRRAFLRALGAYVRRMHDAGLEHRDLKEANVLARGEAATPTFVLLDLEDVSVPMRLSRRKRVRTLVQLQRTLDRDGSRRDGLAFLQGYSSDRDERRRTAKALMQEVVELSARKDVAQHEAVIRHIDHAGYAWVTTLEGARVTEQIMDFEPAALARHTAVVKHWQTAGERCYELLLRDGDRYLLSVVSPAGEGVGLCVPADPDAAQRWERAVRLRAAGLPVTLPAARATPRAGGLAGEMLVVPVSEVEWDLDRAFSVCGDAPVATAVRAAALAALGRLVADLHAAGEGVGRLRPAHVRMDRLGRLRIVDTASLEPGAVTDLEQRVADLAMLDRRLGEGLAHPAGGRDPSRSDRLRVLAAYVEHIGDGFEGHDLRAWVDRILGRIGHRERVTEPDETRAPVSCFIICKDEEAFIRDCLESVRWCDDVVVIDSFSTDRTVEICREYTDRVVQRPWPGFVEQKRYGLGLARNRWVLNLDADERVSPELRREILECVRRDDPEVWGYYIPRLVYYLGRWWRHGWYPEYRLRLFRKARVRWGGVDPHERAFLEDERRSRRLRGDLWHLTYLELSDQVETINRFTSIAAREAAGRGKRFHWYNLIVNPGVHLFKFGVLKRGHRLGSPGFSVAYLVTFHVFLKYAKLWEILQRSAAERSTGKERLRG